MKKIGDIMKDLGFREEASAATKTAFIKYLIRTSYNVEVDAPRKKTEPPQQLEFNLEAPLFEEESNNINSKKVS